MKIQHDIKIVFYDYIKVEEVTKSMQEHQVLGNITNWLKNSIAGDLDIAVVALAQMSDYVTEERGFKIANSEKIKNYASSVVYLIEKTQEQIGNEFGEELSGNSYFFVEIFISTLTGGCTAIGLLFALIMPRMVGIRHSAIGS